MIAAVTTVCLSCGILVGRAFFGDAKAILLAGAVGLGVGIVTLVLLRVWLAMEPERVAGGFIGLLCGSAAGALLLSGMPTFPNHPATAAAVYGLVMALLSLIGMQLGAAKATELRGLAQVKPNKEVQIAGILDTSVIIDGRIADVCETGFITGALIIPQFVLQELQAIADSSEPTRRTRGRRGLDILNKIKKQSYIKIIVDERDYQLTKEVDQKLIQMAKETGCPLITNDFNLNKVAEVHSIQVLNINSLATALKPIVLPGETMRVQIIKEGKEAGQGVAYLDDGTMVVVENGRRHMGKTLEVTVTSVLQTTAGRMIFASIRGIV
ncbi:MAG: TRAM domain-containing protein [Desulfomonile sp.]|nr:TRAM domain-containing protein [Desulfomonile sp.]